MKKRIWLIAAIVVVVAALALSAFFIFGRKQAETPEEQEMKIYYNIDRLDYMPGGKEGQSGTLRGKRKDGNYHVLMSVDGQQVDVCTADQDIVNRMDFQDFMGLVFDENDLVVDVVPLDRFETPLVAHHGYLYEVKDSSVVVNTSGVFTGVEKEYTISEDTPIVGISGGQALAGYYTKLAADDEVWVVTDSEYNVKTIYRSGYVEPDDIYWNVERMYNTTLGMSTRESSPMGYYIIPMAVNGEIVDINVRDMDIVNLIDKRGAKCMMLDFDEDGFVTGVRSPGVTFGSWYHVTEVAGSSISVKRYAKGNDYGKEDTGTMSKECHVYDVTGNAAFVGQETTVQVGDQIHALKDSRGRVHTIFVVGRKTTEGTMAWNLNRQWDSTNACTKRVPVNGWYEFTLAVNGKQGVYKTKDKTIANYMDSFYCRGIVTNGNIIEKAFSQNNVTGGDLFCSWCEITSIQGNVITAEKKSSGTDQGTVFTGKLSSEHVAVNVSDLATVKGEYTTLKVGDTIHSLTNWKGEAVYSFVISRILNTDLYWNRTRMYNSEKQCTTRKPAEDGFYYIQLAVNGKMETVKANKEMADAIDAPAYRCFCLEFNDKGEVSRVIYYKCARVASGGSNGSWVDVTSIKKNTVTAVKNDKSAATNGTVYTIPTDSKTKIYNVSGTFKNNYGEETTLSVGDKVHVVMNSATGCAGIIYVVERSLPSAPVYWNLSRKYDSDKACTTRVPDADGWYQFDMCSGGKRMTLKTKSTSTADFIDSCVAQCMALVVNGDVIEEAAAVKSGKNAEGGTDKYASWAAVTQIDSNGTVHFEKDGNKVTYKLASDCQVVNTTMVYSMNRGELTKLMVGDTVHVLLNKNKQISYAFIVSSKVRTLDLTVKQNCPHADSSVKWINWDGDVSKLKEGGSYKLTKDVTVTEENGIVLDGLSVNIDLNGYTIRGTAGRAIQVKNACSVKICDHTGKGTIEAVGGATLGGNVLLVSNGVSSLYVFNVHLQQIPSDGENYITTKEGGVVQSAGNVYLDNCLIENGHSAKGGNLFASAAGKLYVHDCTVQNGVSTGSGGNIMVGGINATNPAKVFLYNSTVTGGTAKSGDGIYISATCSQIEVAGKVTVKDNNKTNLYLGAANLLSVGTKGLSAGTEIGVTLNGTSVLLTTKTDLSAYFTSDAGKVVSYEDGAVIIGTGLKPVAHAVANHCVCGGTKPAGHSCTNATWTALTQDNIDSYLTTGVHNASDDACFKTAGCYYLATDIKLSKTLEVAKDTEVTICLNGRTLTSPDNLRVFYPAGGTLNICDCTGKGEAVGLRANYSVMMTTGGSTVNLYGGTLCSGATANTAKCGVIYLGMDKSVAQDIADKTEATVFNMYGGTVDGTTTRTITGDCGTIWMLHSVTVNMYGGTVKGGKAGGNGGNIFADVGTTLNMYGGAITGGTAGGLGGNVYTTGKFNGCGGSVIGGTASTGKGVYATTGSNVTVSGSFVADGVFLKTGKMNVGTMTEGASVKVGMTTLGVFAENLTADYSAYFGGEVAYTGVSYEGGKLTLNQEIDPNAHSHCACVGTDTTCGHTKLVWKEWDGTAATLQAGGNFYLTKDVEITVANGIVLDGKTVSLCLNGYNLTGDSRLFYLKNAASLTITNCKTTGKMTGKGNITDSSGGGLILCYNSVGTLKLYNLTMEQVKNANETYTTVKEGGVIGCSGTFYMVKCAVRNGHAYKGGNLNFWSSKTVTIIDSVIENGVALKNGSSEGYGGNVRLGNTGAYTLTNTTVTGGSAKNYASGVAVSSNTGSFTVSGATKIYGNESSNLFLDGTDKLSVGTGGLTTGASIGVTLGKTATSISTNTSYVSYFFADTAGKSVVAEGGKLVIK